MVSRPFASFFSWIVLPSAVAKSNALYGVCRQCLCSWFVSQSARPWYTVFLQALHLILVLQHKEKDVRFPLLKATFQVTAATLVGLHYYVTVFEPAMLDQSPQTKAGAYAFYSLVFVVMTLLSRATTKDAHKQK